MMVESKSIVLMAIVLGTCLTLANFFTEPKVKAQRQVYAVSKLKEVIAAAEVELLYRPDSTSHELRDGNNTIGRLEQLIATDGYNGDIVFWLATMDEQAQSKVIGVRVISHHETPGLGDKLELGISNWVLDFNGESLNSARWDVKKYGGDFDQFSGATITPRAVIRRIAARLRELEQIHQKRDSSDG